MLSEQLPKYIKSWSAFYEMILGYVKDGRGTFFYMEHKPVDLLAENCPHPSYPAPVDLIEYEVSYIKRMALVEIRDRIDKGLSLKNIF